MANLSSVLKLTSTLTRGLYIKLWPSISSMNVIDHKVSKDKKIDEIPQSEKDDLEDTEKKIAEAQSNKEAVLAGYAAGNPQIQQLIDITLLQNNMLTGEALSNFVKRSIELMK